MNNFGLGLILNLTDNATSGIRSATGAFNELNSVTTNFSSANNAQEAFTQIAMGARILGDDLYAVGNRITSFFTGVINKVNETGTTILSARSQLSTLYGDDISGANKLEEIKDYAAHSIFNFEDLIPSVIMLKANGIEAFDQIATSAYRASNGVEGYSQTLMDYASDLAAFNPQMHNVYGTGVQAAIGALNEYIAEGNAMSLKRGASLDITALLGEEKGATIEERSRQVADLIEQLGMVGMTVNLANTPMQRLSNLGDLVFNTMTKIADYGVFDKYSEIVSRVSDYLMETIKEEEWTNLAKVIGEALSDLLDLLNPIVDIMIKAVDKVRELIATNPELVKTIIKYTAFAGALLLASGVALKLMSSLGFLRMSISALFKGMSLSKGGAFIALLKNFAKYLAPVTAGIILFKEAWDRDFMGMQGGIAEGITKAWESLKLIFDAFTDNTLSADGFEKAKELGILPLIEAILQLKYHWGFFIEGVKKGVDAFFATLSTILVKTGILDTDVSSLGELIVSLLDKLTAPGLTDTWEKVGYFVGKFGSWLLLIVSVMPALISAFKLVSGVFNIIIPLVKGLFTLLFGANGFGLLIVLIGALVYVIIKNWDTIKSFIVKAWSSAVEWCMNAIDWFVNGWKEFIDTIKGAWSKFVNWFKTGWSDFTTLISETFSKVVNWIKDTFDRFVNWVSDLFTSISEAIKNWFTNLVQGVKDLWSSITDFFKGIPSKIKDWFFNSIVNPISEGIDKTFDGIKNKITNFKNSAKEAIQSVGDFFLDIFGGVGDFFNGFFQNISDKFNSLKNWAGNVVSSGTGAVGGWFSDKISSIKNMVGLSTGGYVKTTGIAVLHPNEVVVNDDITKGLSSFLSEYESNRGNTVLEPLTPVYRTTQNYSDSHNRYFTSNYSDSHNSFTDSHNKYLESLSNTSFSNSYADSHNDYSSTQNSIMYDNRKSYTSPVSNYVSSANNTTNVYEGSTSNSAPQDNRVTFESGSIVFNIDKNTDISDEGLNQMADKLMKIMSRKLQLRTLQTRA